LTVCQSQPSVRDLVHAAGELADLEGHPATRTIGEGQTRCGDPIVTFGPASIRAVRITATPPPLVPCQLGRLAEARQIHERHDPLVLKVGKHATVGAPRPGATALDVDLDRLPTVVDAEHVHIRQSDQQLHHAFGVTLQSGSPSEVGKPSH
jgi:hypothetical protein